MLLSTSADPLKHIRPPPERNVEWAAVSGVFGYPDTQKPFCTLYPEKA